MQRLRAAIGQESGCPTLVLMSIGDDLTRKQIRDLFAALIRESQLLRASFVVVTSGSGELLLVMPPSGDSDALVDRVSRQAVLRLSLQLKHFGMKPVIYNHYHLLVQAILVARRGAGPGSN